MSILTKTEGYFIIGASAVELDGNVLSCRDDAPIQEFDSKEEMILAHLTQFPDQYNKGFDKEPHSPDDEL